MARRYMKNERAGNSLQATALVHEVYLRLVDVTKVEWQQRAQFFAMAAQMMRRILVTRRAPVVRKSAVEASPTSTLRRQPFCPQGRTGRFWPSTRL